MQAFCGVPLRVPLGVSPSRYSSRQALGPIRCATKPPSKSKQSRSKRPRSNKAGFNQKADASDEKTSADSTEATEEPKEESSGPDLQKVDRNGISLEHRLREEILHPLRKPKQTLFGTLAFSATLGFFFAVARFASEKDSALQVAKNVAVDLGAITIFAYLTWRESDFGRRSLNSIAGRPQARDLRVVSLSKPTVSVPLLESKPLLSKLLGARDVVVAVGRRTDVLKYMGRCVADGGDRGRDTAVVAFATDSRDTDGAFVGADAVAAGESEAVADWVAWLGDAIPPRKNVALFRIDRSEKGLQAANAYVVAVDDPSLAPLPAEAKRPEVVEV